jgi:hypothetical protein
MRFVEFPLSPRLARIGTALLIACTCLWLLSSLGCSTASTLASPPPPPAKNFTVSVSPVTITASPGGSSSTFSVSVTAQNGFTGAVAIALSGLPSGATTSPASPFNVTAGSSQTVSLSLPSSASPGSVTVMASGTSGTLAHSASLALTINGSQDFSLSVVPSAITGNAGASTTFSVSVTGQNGFAGAVAITLSGLPSGATTSPSSPFNVTAGSSQTVTLTLPATASPGSATVMASGTSGALTHSASLALTVLGPQDFSIGVVPPTITANAGTSNTTFSVSVTGQNGFAGAVTITLSGLPAGSTTSPASPFIMTAGSSQTVTLTIPSTSPTGVFPVAVSGMSGILTHAASVSLTVNPFQDFSVALFPSAITVGAGGSSSNFAVSILGQNGFSAPVTVTLSGLPAGVTSSPASPFTMAAGITSQKVELYIPSSVPAGSFTATATGTSGTQTNSVQLVVNLLAQTPVTTWHYDNARTSADTSETILNPTNVNSSSFGLLATLPVDGFVVGHPLYLPQVNVLNQGVHNVLYVATMHDSVFAFDADSSSATPLWMTSILTYSPAGATSVPATVQNNGPTTGWSEIGIISTPVIDPGTGTLYLVAETYEGGNVVHRLHALDVTSGLEKFGGPTTIAAVNTQNGTTTTFADHYQINRPALLLANGHIYIGFGSNCCNATSQGWVMSYNAATLQQEGTYTPEPGKTLASIWQKGAGLSADSSGYVYAETSEGFYAEGVNLSSSVVKLNQVGTILALTDWFSPYNQAYLSANDLDLNNAVLILPDQPGPYLHEAIAEGKEGKIYLLNRDNMGQYCSGCPSDTQIVQEIPLGAGKQSGNPVYWNNTVYFTGSANPVFAYTLNNGSLVVPAGVQSLPINGGGHGIVTSNGDSNGIVWFPNGDSIWAVDAITLQTLYTTQQAPNGRDALQPLAHFATMIAADGKIFMGTQTSVMVYGLFSGTATLREKHAIIQQVSFRPRTN